MKYPDFRKAPEGATHFHPHSGLWCNERGWFVPMEGFKLRTFTDWGSDNYIPIPVVDWSKAPEGCDYAYTTGPDWKHNPELLGSINFADKEGFFGIRNTSYLDIADDAWVLLETRPEIEKETPALVKDYKVLEVFVDKETNPLRYRGYWGNIEISLEDNVIYGKITGIMDLVTYEADTIVGIKEAFMDAVDDYILTREELDK